jgi:beta-lactamase class A
MGRLRQKPRRNNTLLLSISIFMVLGAVFLFVFELVNFTQRENALPQGISVAGVPVGGLTPSQAQALWEQAYAEPITLIYGDSPPIVLNPDTIGFRINSATLLADAIASSEAGGGFWERFLNYLLGQENITLRDIPLVADYQRNALSAYLENEIAARYDQTAGRAGYDVATLTTFAGASGTELDVDAAVDAIDAALRRPSDREVILPLSQGEFVDPSLATLEDLIIAYLDSQGFIYDGQTSVASIFIMDLTTGDEINILGDVAFTAASTSKVPILIDYFRVLDGEPTQDDAWLMANSLLCSQNSTSNLIMSDILGNGDLFSGIASVTRVAQSIGARNTFLTAPYADGSPDQQFGSIAPPETQPNPTLNTDPDPFNQTTAEDMGTMFNLIYDCAEYRSGLMAAYPNGEFTQRECQQMIELMSGLDLNRLLEAGIPDNVRIAHKNGWVGEVTGNAGIVFPPSGRDYIISVYLWEDTGATGFQDYIRLWPLIEDISRATWNYFNPEQALLSRRTNIPTTAQECFVTNSDGTREYTYLPPYGEVNLNDIDGWRQ